MPPKKSLDTLAIDTIRTLAMDAVQAANSGHPGTPMALAPLGWMLFSRVRAHDPAHPEWPDRDRFVLSAGHASMLQYGLLFLTGYDLSLDDIRHFRQWDSRTPGHPELHVTPGVETTTGPLGQGFANAVGMALAERHLAARFNRPDHILFDHRTYVIASDGDMMEGVSSEAASLAGHLQLGKLIVFWDDNRITIDGSTELSFTEDVLRRFEAYGWHVQSVEDGNDIDALLMATDAAHRDERPSFIRVRTIIGYPAPTKQNTSAAHGAPLGEEEVARAKQVMGWPAATFVVPTELDEAREKVRAEGAKRYGDWTQRLAAYERTFPNEAAALRQALEGKLPEGWDRDLPAFPADAKGMPTRKASGKLLSVLASRVPTLVGGSADLATSNNTYLDKDADFVPPPQHGVPRNIHWGVREHAMGSICNGLALHGGVLPYAATFLVFSDYMRPPIRLAALMQLPVRYVFTHDSIGLGEDGPTHQPVEHLAALRAIPGLTVLRPCDANEVTECWAAALERRKPAALILTRQNLPVLDRSTHAPASGARRGAYVLAEAEGSAPHVILIATGSEVSIALDARKQLQTEKIPTRVVSMPSWELFAEQDDRYREEVLPQRIRARVVIEAASRFGWERWVGGAGGFVTLDHFGASAPAEVLFEKFGFTTKHVIEVAKKSLERAQSRQ